MSVGLAVAAAGDTPAVKTVAHNSEEIERLLDIRVEELRVPCVGDTAPVPGSDLPVLVFDPAGNEIEWVTRSLRSLKNDGLAETTLEAYAKSFLRAARPMWAIDVEPRTLTLTQYAVVRGWLRLGLRRTGRREGDAGRPLAGSTLKGTEAALMAIYGNAKRAGLIPRNPIADYRKADDDEVEEIGKVRFDSDYDKRPHGKHRPIAKVNDKPIVTLTPDARHILRHAKKSRDRALWTLCLDSGPRISEALSLTPATFDPAYNRAEVVGKGLDGGTRTIPICDETIEAIQEYLSHLATKGFRPGPDDPIFRSLHAPYAPQTYNAAYKSLKRQLNDENVHPHALRHTAATELIDLLEGTQSKRIANLRITLGHKQLSTTQRYLHVSDTSVIAAHLQARMNKPREASPVLRQTYGEAELNLLKEIRLEAP